MKKKNINWNTIDEQIKKLKFPLTFIYNILKNQNKIEDYHLSLIIRFFLKNQTSLSIECPLFSILGVLNDDFVITKRVINDFYSSILKKYIFINIILKFKLTYDDSNFWEKDLYSQKYTLENMLLIFKSHFDASLSGINGVTKFVSQLKCNNNYINLHIKSRLNESINIFGVNFLIRNNIKLLTEQEYDSLNINNKIKFIIYYFIKVDKYMRTIISLYDLLIIYDNKIKQIITPRPIYINFNRIYSENDSEDINLMIEHYN